jgi:hypothetical protein
VDHLAGAEEARRRLGEQRWIDAIEYVQGAQFFPSAT